MKESIAQGPLDLVRAINEEAASLDWMLATHPKEVTLEELALASGKLNGFNQHNPLIGDEVTLFGDVISNSMNDFGETCLVTPWVPDEFDWLGAKELMPASGKYNGYHIMSVYNPELERAQYRVVHSVFDMGSTFSDIDINGRMVTYTYGSHVLVGNSEIEPDLPIKAHSLQDLYGDPIAEQFDAVIRQQNYTQSERVKMLGRIGRRAFADSYNEDGLDKQRISYLNDSHVLSGAGSVFSKDVLMGSKEDIEKTLIEQRKPIISDASKEIKILPRMFELAFAYVRTSRDRGIIDASTLDLYLSGFTERGQSVMAPLKNVEVRS